MSFFVKFLTISLELLHFYTKYAESPKFAQIWTIVLYPNDYITHPIIIDFDFWAIIFLYPDIPSA